MKITIDGRFSPFSHRAGTHVLIPKTQIVVEVYPSRIRFYSCKSLDIYEMDIQTGGYVDGFTVIQDLETQVVRVFGTSGNGYVSYELQFSDGHIVMHLIRSRGPLNITFQGETLTLKQWARNIGINQASLRERIERGWPIEEALTRPSRFAK